MNYLIRLRARYRVVSPAAAKVQYPLPSLQPYSSQQLLSFAVEPVSQNVSHAQFVIKDADARIYLSHPARVL